MAFSAPRITIYECKYLSPDQLSPDGHVPDEVWEEAKLDTRFYEYWIPEPGIAAFETGLRMYYSDEGIYLNITFFEELPDQVKATRTTRGDPELWTDDCVEIYFDPINSGTGYLKFTANLLETRHNLKVDENTGLTDSTWSPENWKVTVNRISEGYEMLVFIPWDVFQSKPKAGDIWTFNLVRYRYATGSFQGSTWSPGGNYGSPYMFGNILFGGGFSKEVETIARAIAPVKGEAWEFISDSGVVIYSSFKQMLLEKIDLLENELNEAEWRFLEFNHKDERLQKFKEQVGLLKNEITNMKVDVVAFETFVKEIDEIVQQLKELVYQTEIDFLLVKGAAS